MKSYNLILASYVLVSPGFLFFFFSSCRTYNIFTRIWLVWKRIFFSFQRYHKCWNLIFILISNICIIQNQRIKILKLIITFKLCGLVLLRVSTSLICFGNFLLTKVNKPLLATLGPLTPDCRRYFKVFQGTLEDRGVWYNIGHSEHKYRK